MKEEKYIQLLKYGRDNLDGIEYKVLREKLKSLGLPFESDGMAGTPNSFLRNIFVDIDRKFVLTFEAYFHLFEHERLEEARKDSKKAIRISNRVLYVTIAFFVVSSIINILLLCKY